MTIEHLNFLLVEDHDFQRRTLRRLLGGLGAIHITDVADGAAALSAVQQADQPFDICIMDLNMPGMDGMELIRHLSEAKSQIAIILASALDHALISSVETMAKAYGVKLLGAIEKPATALALRPLIEQYGAQRRPQRAPLGGGPEITLEDLREALTLDQFEPYFQPKADLQTGAITAAEALARWRHPERGMIPPDAFIPLMEHHGLIDDLTACIARKTALAWRAWARQGHRYEISINLSLSQLSRPGYADDLSRILEEQDIAPRYIVFEVTESAAMSDLPHSLENLARLRMKGYGLSIDDYGTGYSSMQQLLRIPFSELKVDRSFVTAACQDPAQVLILNSSLSLARELKLSSVAEGVETAADWRLLRRLQCGYAQGWLVGEPMSASDFIPGVAAWDQAYSALPADSKHDRASA